MKILVNTHKATPNLRIITLWGISFLDDSHIEAFSSNCIQLQVKKFAERQCLYRFLMIVVSINIYY